jgi:hypothetical protein
MEFIENQKLYECKLCNYFTLRKSSYDKHMLSQKHIYEFNNSEKDYCYKCKKCNKGYKNKSGLWKHKQNCCKLENYDKLESSISNLDISNLDISNINNLDINNLDISNVKISSIMENQHLLSIVLQLVKQNQEFKELLLEQNKQIIEICKDKDKTINYNTTNNNQFNLNFFLNETCKDAMNISDFVEQLPIYLSDLEETARLGFAEGITRIFTRGLKELELNKRPIHCSDGKRETLYIKENDKWEKDDINKSKLEKMVRKVGTKNIRMIPEWKKKYPDCTEYNSKKNDLYLKIVGNSMCGGTVEETENNYNKIKKNIIKNVIIPK